MTGSGSNHYTRALYETSENGHTFSPDSDVLAVFIDIARKLTDRQDRHERLYKISRDITIESKRIIFLLHSTETKEKTKNQIINEAAMRIRKLLNGHIKKIAIELETQPAHLYARAITAGLQEFIEAWTFCSLEQTRHIITCDEIQKEFTYTIKSDDNTERKIATPLPPSDYMLGLADLSGELMRKAINSIASGDHECFIVCKILRLLYAGFLGLSGGGTHLVNKLNTTRANVDKVERTLYAFRVRRSEKLLSTYSLPSEPPLEDLPSWDHN